MKTNNITTKYILKQKNIKILFIILILYSIYSAFVNGRSTPNTVDSILLSFINIWSNIFMLLTVSIGSLSITRTLEDMTIFKIRNKNKAEEMESISRQVAIFTILFTTLYSLIQIILIIITHGFNNNEPYILAYNIPYIYCIFFIIRYIVIITLYALIVSSLTPLLPQAISILIFGVGAFLLYMYPYNFNVTINNLFETKLYIGYYFSILSYGNFSNEIFCSSFYIIILLLGYMLIQKFIFSKKDILIKLNKLYLILKNDINTIKNDLKKYIISFILIIFGVYIFKTLTKSFYDNNSLYQILGLNFNNSTDIISIFLSLAYIFTFIYISFYLFFKDILYQTSNYFLRIKFDSWYIYKTFTTMLITISIKILYYIAIFIISLILSIELNNIWLFFLYDCIITFFIEQSFILIYISSPKIKLISLIYIIFILSSSGISVVLLGNKIVLYIIGLLISSSLMIWNCKKNKNLLFERKIKI